MAYGSGIGNTPMPPPEVLAQMAPDQGQPQPSGFGAALGEAAPQVPGSEDMPEIESLMSDIARDVPGLAPDADLLMTKLKAEIPASEPGPQTGFGNAVVGPAPAPGPEPVSNAQPAGGVLQKAVQLELKLVKLAAKNPNLAKDVQFFVVRMRDEVPKVHDSATPPTIPVADGPTERATGLAVAA